jgi:simple sugar transport system permease protein
VIGGVALMGGKGSILGILIGSALLFWIQDVLLLLGAPGFYLSAFIGALVILAAFSYRIANERRAR